MLILLVLFPFLVLSTWFSFIFISIAFKLVGLVLGPLICVICYSFNIALEFVAVVYESLVNIFVILALCFLVWLVHYILDAKQRSLNMEEIFRLHNPDLKPPVRKSLAYQFGHWAFESMLSFLSPLFASVNNRVEYIAVCLCYCFEHYIGLAISHLCSFANAAFLWFWLHVSDAIKRIKEDIVERVQRRTPPPPPSSLYYF